MNEMARRARTGGATVMGFDGPATVTYTDGVGYLLQVTDDHGGESAAIVLSTEAAAELADALHQQVLFTEDDVRPLWEAVASAWIDGNVARALDAFPAPEEWTA